MNNASCFSRRCALSTLLGGLLLSLGLPLNAQAQAVYPAERTLRIVTPYAPGSLVDVTTRLVADGLRAELGQNVVVENRTGGTGMIAMNALLSAAPDGYTLLTDTPAAAINPTLYKAKYNPKTEIAPIAQFMRLPFAIGVHPSLPVRTAAELVEHARKNPGRIDMAVAGTSTRLAGELFSIQNGIKFNPIPYKGAPERDPADLSRCRQSGAAHHRRQDDGSAGQLRHPFCGPQGRADRQGGGLCRL